MTTTGSLFLERICRDMQSLHQIPVMASVVIKTFRMPQRPTTVAVPNANYNRAVQASVLKLED
jgi:hypothetical protein